MNLIILTTGLSGSSVVTGLIARAGFWTGEDTVYKNNSTGTYQTYENTRLVELNEQLIQASGYHFDHNAWYDETAIHAFEQTFNQLDDSPFRAFVEQENAHSPFLWKDPKLWFTLADWHSVYRPPARGKLLKRHLLAWPIYLKNYRERIKG